MKKQPKSTRFREKPEVKMELHMNERKAVTRETRGERHKAGKKEKGLILDQYVRLTGYNRKPAVRVLSKPAADKTVMAVMAVIDGKTVVCQAEKKMRPKNRLGKPIYTGETVVCIEAMWRFYWHKCGTYLAELIRQTSDFLTTSRRPDFHLTPDIRAQLLTISGRQSDRLLKPAKEVLKTPCQRLMESSLTEEQQVGLTAQRALLNQGPCIYFF